MKKSDLNKTVRFNRMMSGKTYLYKKLPKAQREFRRAFKMVCAAASCPMTQPNKAARWTEDVLSRYLGDSPQEGAMLQFLKYCGIKLPK